MSTQERLGRLLGLGIEESVRECRHCGTNVEPEETVCPTCDSDGLVEYDL